MRATVLSLTILVFMSSPVAAQSLTSSDDQAKPGQGTQKPAPAQTTKPKPKPAPKLPIGFRVFGGFDFANMAASSTFKGVTGSSTLPGFGVGAEVLNVWRKAFIRGAFSTSSVDGERGFVTDTGFISTGVPISIGVRYMELGGGWRLYPGKQQPVGPPKPGTTAKPGTAPKKPKQQPVAVYFGTGLLFGTISQTSQFATGGDDGSKTGAGFFFLAGFEYAVTKQLVVGVEGAFRSVGGGVLGTDGSVSGAYNEKNAGGEVIRALVGYRFKK